MALDPALFKDIKVSKIALLLMILFFIAFLIKLYSLKPDTKTLEF